MAERRAVSFVASGGLRLAGDGARRSRPAPPVVLLHGGGQTRHAWGGTAAALAGAGWHAIALDLRGHGDSDWAPDGDYALERFAADLARRARAARAPPPALVGASLGGITSLLAVGRGRRRPRSRRSCSSTSRRASSPRAPSASSPS